MNKSDQSDRKLGYILMLLTVLFAAGFVSYFVFVMNAPHETRVLRFPEVGTLSIEDPVRMSGTLVGIVGGFEHDSLGRVLVYVHTPRNPPIPIRSKSKERFPESIPIRTSSEVIVSVKGLMGERFIEITQGNLSDPLVPKDQIIDGVFKMGPSEAIVYMDVLNDKIIELRDIMLRLRDGGGGKRSFIAAFNDVIGTVDTLVWELLRELSDIEEGVAEGLATAADITDQALKLTADVSVKAPEILESVNSMMVKIDNVITKIDTVFVKLDKLSRDIDGNKYLWGDHAERMQKQIGDIRAALESARRNGIDLRVRLRFFGGRPRR